MIRIGIAGWGFMGKMHSEAFARIKGVSVVAIADSREEALKDTIVRGNVAALKNRSDVSRLTIYKTLDALIADPRVDVVDVTLPTPLHAESSIRAMAAGKAVICEKPMARTSAEALRMAKAAKRYGVPLFIAHCIRFWPEYAAAKRIVAEGRYGKVVQAAFTRLSAAPAWSDWFRKGQMTGGAALDLHVHDADFVQYLLGMPVAVSSVGSGDRRWPDHIATHYLYRDAGLCITAEGGWRQATGFPFHMSFRIVLEGATLTFGWGTDPRLTIHEAGGRTIRPKAEKGDGYARELAYFVECLRRGRKPAVVTPESSVATIRLVEAEIRSAALGGKPVRVAK